MFRVLTVTTAEVASLHRIVVSLRQFSICWSRFGTGSFSGRQNSANEHPVHCWVIIQQCLLTCRICLHSRLLAWTKQLWCLVRCLVNILKRRILWQCWKDVTDSLIQQLPLCSSWEQGRGGCACRPSAVTGVLMEWSHFLRKAWSSSCYSFVFHWNSHVKSNQSSTRTAAKQYSILNIEQIATCGKFVQRQTSFVCELQALQFYWYMGCLIWLSPFRSFRDGVKLFFSWRWMYN